MKAHWRRGVLCPVLTGLLVAAGIAPAMGLAPAPAAAASASAKPTQGVLPPGQVWECIVNGQRIFSDTRCGAGASVRQLNEVNRMDPPAAAPSRVYGYFDPGYTSAAVERESPNSADDLYGAPPLILVDRRVGRVTPAPPRRRSHVHVRGR